MSSLLLSRLRQHIKAGHYYKGENFTITDSGVYVSPVYASRTYRLKNNFYDSTDSDDSEPEACCICLRTTCEDICFMKIEASEGPAQCITGGYATLLDDIKVFYSGDKFVENGRVCRKCLFDMDVNGLLKYGTQEIFFTKKDTEVWQAFRALADSSS